MNNDTLHQVSTIAQHYNHEGFWSKESFRFKNREDMDKSTLLRLKHANVIKARDDAWSQTTWEWTEDGSICFEMVTACEVHTLSERQQKALSEHNNILLELPRNDTFKASEYNLIGQNLQTLSSTGFIQQVGEVGQVAVWRLTEFALGLLTQLEAVEIKQRGTIEGNERHAVAVQASD